MGELAEKVEVEREHEVGDIGGEEQECQEEWQWEKEGQKQDEEKEDGEGQEEGEQEEEEEEKEKEEEEDEALWMSSREITLKDKRLCWAQVGQLKEDDLVKKAPQIA